MIAACPRCLNRYEVPDAAAGKRATCPKCQHRFTIPGTARDSPYTPGTSSATLENPFAPAPKSAPAKPRRSPWAAVGVGVLAVGVVIAVVIYLGS